MSEYMDGWKGRKSKDGFWSAQRRRGDDDRRAHQKRMASPVDFGKRNSQKRQVNYKEHTWRSGESGTGLFSGFKVQKSVASNYTPASRRNSPRKESEKGSFVGLLVVAAIILVFFDSNHNRSSPSTKTTPAIVSEYPDRLVAKTKKSIPVVHEEPIPEVHGVPNPGSLAAFASPDPVVPPPPASETPKQRQDVPITPVVPESEVFAAAPNLEPDVKEPQSSNEMVFAASREGAANGCKNGELVMGISTISFSCPSNPARGITVNANQVKAVDGNGIETYSNAKYHFEISGRSKQETALFSRSGSAGHGFKRGFTGSKSRKTRRGDNRRVVSIRFRLESDPEPMRQICGSCGERYLPENLEDCIVCKDDTCPRCGTWVTNSETDEESYICDMCRDYRPGWWNGNVVKK